MSANGASTSDSGVAVSSAKKESKKPKYSKFTQQELPACKPLLTPGWVIATFMVVGIIFIPIGAVTLLASNGVVEIVHDYENACLPPNVTTRDDKISFIQDSTRDKTCSANLRVPDKMSSPIYVYYQLDNFYQNHRRYVKSRNDKQLRGDAGAANQTDGCKPEATWNGAPIVPCGLIAWSLFNDTYTVTRGQSEQVNINKHGIAWKSDREDKFGQIKPQNFANNPNTSGGPLVGGAALNESNTLQEDEDLIVWMRTAALPTFRKLYGKIEEDLLKDQIITVEIKNNYNTYTFGGGKKLVFSTTSWLGGKNNFLGIAYLTVGILCMFLAFVFFLVHFKNPRPLGDPSYLSWNRKTPSTANSSH